MPGDHDERSGLLTMSSPSAAPEASARADAGWCANPPRDEPQAEQDERDKQANRWTGRLGVKLARFVAGGLAARIRRWRQGRHVWRHSQQGPSIHGIVRASGISSFRP
jgi:hypothetical protein